MILIVLTGCEAGGSGADNPVTPPPDKTIQIQPDLTLDPLLPPGAEVRPPQTGELGRVRNESGLPILDPKGPKLEQLFAREVKVQMRGLNV